MNERRKPSAHIAFLIDADNLSADVIEQAIEHLMTQFGAIHFRRAYCSPQKVIEHMDLFRRHAIRPMVNVPTGKNSTDIALAVDAIDLAISERPAVVVIGSSDSDYAPLAQRLREKGCKVIGIGQAGKTGGDSPLAYDDFIDLAHRKAPTSGRSVGTSGTQRTSARAPAPALAPAAEASIAPVRKRAATSRGRAAKASPAPAPLSAEVQAILQAVPALCSGAAIELGEVGEALRRLGILTSKSASPSRHLKHHAEFELAPADRPRTVRFIG